MMRKNIMFIFAALLGMLIVRFAGATSAETVIGGWLFALLVGADLRDDGLE